MEEHIGSAALLGHGHTADVYVWKEDSVLKLFVPGFPSRLIDQEMEGTWAANAAGIPSPEFRSVVTVDGRRGLVLERLTGLSMLTLLGREPARVAYYAGLFAELQARMNDCHAPGLTSRREDLARRIARARIVARVKGDALATLERLPDGDSLCHCDFHPDNVLMTPKGPSLIDWSFTSRGTPASDAAQTALLLRIAHAPSGSFRVPWVEREAKDRFYRVWLKRYRELQPDAARTMWGWLLPVTVARLADEIPQERPRLMALIEELQQKH
ncbi:MAG: aminoglycoside phosphotransferase family protein [Caldiserica bacterium]|nr:aminoglycoside phosphotransferase family protein [Caldisericota bacterium]